MRRLVYLAVLTKTSIIREGKSGSNYGFDKNLKMQYVTRLICQVKDENLSSDLFKFRVDHFEV